MMNRANSVPAPSAPRAEVGDGDQGDVHGVEHDLEAHHHEDDVAAREHAERADAEQQEREEQPPVQGVHGAPSRGVASTMAPIMAATSTSETSSNGNT